MKKSLIILFIIGFVSVAAQARAKTLVSENFNDRNFSGFQVYESSSAGYCTGTACNYSSSPNHSGSGYSMHGDHTNAYNFLWRYSDGLQSMIQAGMYIRYYIYWSADYDHPADCGASYNNNKIFKMAGSVGNIEVHWANSDVPMNTIKFQYADESGKTQALKNRTFSPSASNGEWIKIEIYIRIPASGSNNSTLKVQINNYTAINETSISFYKGNYDYLQSPSVRASGGSCVPRSGHGEWWGDDLTVVYGEGDLTNNEPPEPGGKINPDPGGESEPPIPPTGLRIITDN